MPKGSMSPPQSLREMDGSAYASIKKLQNSTGDVMSVAPFTRIVREFGQDIEPLLRIEPASLEGLQKVLEGYMSGVMKDLASS